MSAAPSRLMFGIIPWYSVLIVLGVGKHSSLELSFENKQKALNLCLVQKVND